jgi:exosortase family protein XrtG
VTPLILVAAAVSWLAVVYFFYRYRIWLPFYVIGAVGLAFLVIAVGRTLLPLETLLEQFTAFNVHDIAQVFGVETRIFAASPGVILVLVIPQTQGWTLVDIGVECSGLLEEAVLIGLLSFYPSWSLPRRIGLISAGVAATYLGNLVRVLFIVLTLHEWGKDSLFLAHTLVGRVIFFFIVVGIYWVVLTGPTLKQIRLNLQYSAAP